MRKSPLLAITLALAACGSSSNNTPDAKPPTPDAAVADRHLIILHTNDEHSHVFAYGPEADDYNAAADGALIGGVARRSTALKAERAAATAAHIDTLTVSGGDETQGGLPQVSFTTTAPDFVLLKTLGYDLFIPGNHEFDRGPKAYADALKVAMAHGGIPQMVSTNIHFNGEADLSALYGDGTSSMPIKKYHVITTPSGIKVGFLGAMGAEASSDAPFKTPITFSGTAAVEASGDFSTLYPLIAADLQPTIDTLRNTEKVDVVILVSHGGVNLADQTKGDDYQIATRCTGLDLIVSAHSHTALLQPQLVADPDGHMVPIVQAGAFGQYLGHTELVLHAGSRPTLDADDTKLILLDNTVAEDHATVDPVLDALVTELETSKVSNNQSFLESELSIIEETTVTDNPALPGSLYFRSEGTSTFDVTGVSDSRETDILNLSTDAMMAAADELGTPALIAVQANGIIRANINKGATGALGFADLFRILPLGSDPTDGSIGYPLVLTYVYTAELKAAFEISASLGLVRSDVFLTGSGIRVEYDTSRAAQDLSGGAVAALNPQNGRVTKILIDTNHADGYESPTVALFDITRTGSEFTSSLGDSGLALQPIVTSLYVATFAQLAGVHLKHADGTIDDDYTHYILTRADGSHIKDYEALISYIHKQAAANGGALPSRYDVSTTEGHVPRRMVCTGPLCLQ